MAQADHTAVAQLLREDRQQPLFAREDVALFQTELGRLKHHEGFQLLSAECAFEKMRALVARRMWQLVVVEVSIRWRHIAGVTIKG